MKANKFYSLLFEILVKTNRFRGNSLFIDKYWNEIWNASMNRYSGAIKTKIHGYDVFVNNGYMYPVFSRRFTSYNNPLVELVYQTFKILNRKINIIDVGAAVGDTMLLIMRNCPEMIQDMYCVEGDVDFFEYLNENIGKYSNSHIYNKLLSDVDGKEINELEKIHLGTASSIGIGKQKSLSLDTLILLDNPKTIDLIKIDVDGLDGSILKGSEEIIQKFKPAIIFEWHPIMLHRTGNKFEQPFDLLIEQGYTKLLWFTKYGTFSHFDLDNCLLNHSLWNEFCLRGFYDYDYHFDIIAIHKDNNLDILSLAELQYAKAKRSNS